MKTSLFSLILLKTAAEENITKAIKSVKEVNSNIAHAHGRLDPRGIGSQSINKRKRPKTNFSTFGYLVILGICNFDFLPSVFLSLLK
tara:strand:- start:782 stop:1042 length:261 start_codon:yes stop_codon:yes gene_type:complete